MITKNRRAVGHFGGTRFLFLLLLVPLIFARSQDLNSISTPQTKPELDRLLKQIINYDFPECGQKSDFDNPADWYNFCRSFAQFQAERIGRISNPELVPDLVAIAKTENYPAPSQSAGIQGADFWRKILIVWVRRQAIMALGNIQDPGTVRMLLDNLKGTAYGTTPSLPTLGYNSDKIPLCLESAIALAKIKPKGIAAEVLKNVENHNPYGLIARYKAMVLLDPFTPLKIYDSAIGAFPLDLTGSVEDADRIIMNANADLLAVLRDEARLLVQERLKKKDLEQYQIAMYLGLVARWPMDQETLEFVKENVLDFKKARNSAPYIPFDLAVRALTDNAIPANRELYLWLYQQGWQDLALFGIARCGNGQDIQLFIPKLEQGKPEEAENAAKALQGFPPELLKPAISSLLKRIKSQPYCKSYYQALAHSQDPSAVAVLMELTYSHEPESSLAGRYALEALGRIENGEAQAALRAIISDRKMAGRRAEDALYWLIMQTGPEAREFSQPYLDPEKIELIWELVEEKRNQFLQNPASFPWNP